MLFLPNTVWLMLPEANARILDQMLANSGTSQIRASCNPTVLGPLPKDQQTACGELACPLRMFSAVFYLCS